jgi:hypothetical protein
MRDAVHLVPSRVYLVKLVGHFVYPNAVHPSGMMIFRTVLYKDRFDVYVTNAGDITIRIVLTDSYRSEFNFSINP